MLDYSASPSPQINRIFMRSEEVSWKTGCQPPPRPSGTALHNKKRASHWVEINSAVCVDIGWVLFRVRVRVRVRVRG